MFRHTGDRELKRSSLKLAVKFSIPLILFTSTAYGGIEAGFGQQQINEKYNSTTACLIAETKAIKQALDNFSGREFSVERKNFCYDTKSLSYCNYYKEIDYSISGTIRKIVSRKEIIENSTCKVSLVVDIEQPRQLQVDVQGRNIYYSGEELSFNITAREPVFMYMFNVHRSGVEVLFPFNFTMDNLINRDFVYPGPDHKHVAYLHNGVKKDEEKIILLFTKHYVEFDRVALDHSTLTEVINSIPVHSRKLFTYNILIKRK